MYRLFNSISFCDVISTSFPLSFMCKYLQTFIKLCSNSLSMYFLFTSINIQKPIGYKVFSICFNFSQQCATLKSKWEKKCYVQDLNYQASIVIFPTLAPNMKITKAFLKMRCTLVAFFHFLHHYPFLLFQSLLQKILVIPLNVFSDSQNNWHEEHQTWLLLHVHSTHSNNSFILILTFHDVGIIVTNSVSSFFS